MFAGYQRAAALELQRGSVVSCGGRLEAWTSWLQWWTDCVGYFRGFLEVCAEQPDIFERARRAKTSLVSETVSARADLSLALDEDRITNPSFPSLVFGLLDVEQHVAFC